MTVSTTSPAPRTLGVVLFNGFELLDVFGPLEMFGFDTDAFSVTMLGPGPGPVASRQGPCAHADVAYADATPADVVLVPGGLGTRTLVGDAAFLAWLRAYCAGSEYVTSVCTGSALLAATGLLDGRRSTTNKAAFEWVQSQGPAVEWVAEARWVVDGKVWTSSGVAAGIDMSLALIAELLGPERAREIADRTEYEWHTDAGWDPFAARYVLAGEPRSVS